jgi:hypothetical protein
MAAMPIFKDSPKVASASLILPDIESGGTKRCVQLCGKPLVGLESVGEENLRHRFTVLRILADGWAVGLRIW